ncbi:hypothetical protein LJ737_16500 [Hymenobacter sp. 15J16-1T3B]|uniref:hypothetical protein n=1 Tax=Hymenobacter sp. 15J16-1T3B TaxID=2886941 RepID=UPI001D102423|nr:hypothetical protein [Hymenobacter sp. 15J16-1T3B]MCC3158845.1 hypothetical protein [Hymenobacter sp. 15J16-1T3B]
MPDPAPRPSADEQWEQLVHRWRPPAAAQPRPYFYQRVRARLDDASAARPVWPAWLRRPAYAALLGLLGVALSGDCAALPSAAADAGPQPEASGRPLPAAPGR